MILLSITQNIRITLKEMKKYIIIMTILVTAYAFATDKHPVEWYQNQWCRDHNGQTDIIMPDQTTCDCVTETHAIEYDFGKDWAKSLGHALNDRFLTGKRGGIVLILESPDDLKYWLILNNIVTQLKLSIDTWKIENFEMQHDI